MNSLWIASILLQWLVIAALCVLVLSLIRQIGALSIKLNSTREAAETVKLYSHLPRHDIPTLNGPPFTLGGERRQHPQLIVFYSPTCSACQSLPGALRELAAETPNIDLLIVPSVERDEMLSYLQSEHLNAVPAALREDFPEEYLPKLGVPAAIAVTSQGIVAAKGRPKTLEHLREMLAAAQHMADLATTTSTRQHEWGESAPYWESNAA